MHTPAIIAFPKPALGDLPEMFTSESKNAKSFIKFLVLNFSCLRKKIQTKALIMLEYMRAFLLFKIVASSADGNFQHSAALNSLDRH